MKRIGSSQGFTLIEVAIVILIGGIIMTMLFDTLNTSIQTTKLNTSRQKLATIDVALQRYLELNGRLPCPASPGVKIDDPTYGFEKWDQTNNRCLTVGLGDVVRTNAQTLASKYVQIGVVPVRTINLPDGFMNDAWGSRFTYAVTEELADKATFNRDGGAILVVDSNNNSLLRPSTGAYYTIVSHGRDRYGAYGLETTAGIPTCTGTESQVENCNRNGTFRSTLLTSTASKDSSFDDVVTIRSTSDFARQAIPSGGVLGFDLSSCPTGWTRLVPQPTYAPTLLFCKKS